MYIKRSSDHRLIDCKLKAFKLKLLAGRLRCTQLVKRLEKGDFPNLLQKIHTDTAIRFITFCTGIKSPSWTTVVNFEKYNKKLNLEISNVTNISFTNTALTALFAKTFKK